MYVAENRHPGGHSFERGHVESIFKLRIGRVDVEPVRLQQTLEMVPTFASRHAGHVRIVPDKLNRYPLKGFRMEVPQ